MAVFSTTLFDHQWIPASRGIARKDQKVLVVLHGRGDSLQAFIDIKQEMRLSGFNYLLINAPKKYLDGFSWGALMPRSERSAREIRDRLFALVEELKAAGWKSQDIFWLGHSQGCMIASDLVMHHPERFGGIVGVSGYMRFGRGWRVRVGRSGARQTPWLITHGLRDRVIPMREIQSDVERLSNGRVAVEFRRFAKGHDFDYSREVPFIRQWIRASSRSVTSTPHARRV